MSGSFDGSFPEFFFFYFLFGVFVAAATAVLRPIAAFAINELYDLIK